MNYLIARTDNLGDIVLSLQMVSLIKQVDKAASVTYLSRAYAKALITSAENVDGFICWDHLQSTNKTSIKQQLKPFDVFINVSANRLAAKYAKLANIKLRIGTSHRWYHWLYCNRLVNFSRKRSTLHEIQLNVKLLKPLGIQTNRSIDELWPEIYLTPKDTPLTSDVLDTKRFNLIFHPCSNGNGKEWPEDYFIDLINSLDKEKFHCIITGSASEVDAATRIATHCPTVTNVAGLSSLESLIALIAKADGLVASGTGPLHIAAALGIHTLGIFPPKKPIHPARWRPVGRQAEYLVTDKNDCLTACDNASCTCIRAVTVSQVKQRLMRWLKK